MSFIAIDKRFCGPPNSGNGGYVCGLLAKHFPGSAEITLRAPPPLERELHIETCADGAVELHAAEKLIAAGRPVRFDGAGQAGKYLLASATPAPPDVWLVLLPMA